MSAREWKPGDVAIVDYGFGSERMLRDHRGWWSASTEISDTDESVIDARPLVVIDPEDREAVEGLVRWYYERFAQIPGASVSIEGGEVDAMQAALREFANPTPPKCKAAVNLAGEHFQCVEPEGHGASHRNPEAEAVWGEGA